jgi:hypothetical protein
MVFSLNQSAMEAQQGGWLQDDGAAKNPGRFHQQGAHTDDNPVEHAQVGSALAASLKDQQLMTDQNRLGDNGSKTTALRKSADGNDQMDDQQEGIWRIAGSYQKHEIARIQRSFVIRHPDGSACGESDTCRLDREVFGESSFPLYVRCSTTTWSASTCFHWRARISPGRIPENTAKRMMACSRI